jgi:hypothetical protein
LADTYYGFPETPGAMRMSLHGSPLGFPDGSLDDLVQEEFYLTGNFSCENYYLPSSIQLFESE